MSMRTVVKKFIPKKVFKAVEPWGHKAEAMLFHALNGFPARSIKVIGVTGTNGKTSTTFLIHRMLVDAGYNAGLMTTVAYGVNNDISPQIHHMTTVAVPEMAQRLRKMRKAGMEWLVLETTSQALAQNRVWGMPYSVAVFTNLTDDDSGWHDSFESYRTAKQKMFVLANKNKKGLRTGIVNAEDPNAEYFTKAIAHPVTYGIKAGDLRAEDVQLQPDGVQYDVTVDDEKLHIRCALPGGFNVFNSLAAVAVGRAVGLSGSQIEQGIAALEGVEGRMTKVDEDQPYSVIVDYAHTPDSFEKLFKDLRPVVKGKLIVLFGSAGRRDEAKRPLQGKLAGEYADEVIVTEEDDRDADGLEIMDQIAAGAEQAGKVREQDLFLVHDRTEAISFALSRASTKNDTILLLGKGHEKTIERANGEYPWNEIEITHDLLKKQNRSK